MVVKVVAWVVASVGCAAFGCGDRAAVGGSTDADTTVADDDTSATGTTGSTGGVTTTAITNESLDDEFGETIPQECYFDGDCGDAEVCDLGMCEPVMPVEPCAASLELVSGSSPLAEQTSDIIEIGVVDLDGDAELDAAVLHWEPARVELLLGDGTGAFTSTALVPTGGDTTPLGLALGDVDGDAAADVVVLDDTSPGALAVLLGDGAGGLVPSTTTALGDQPSSVVLADVDDDLVLDAVVVGTYDGLSIALGDGNGGFDVLPPSGGRIRFEGVAVASLVGEPHVDVATAGGFRSVVLYGGGGDGTFAELQHLEGIGETAFARVALADLDGSGGPLDVIAGKGEYHRGLLARWSGIDAPGEYWYLPDEVRRLLPADLDGDGQLEIVAGARGGHGIVVMFGLGGGQPVCGVTLPEIDGQGLAVGDLDGDGRDDLLTTADGMLHTHRWAP